MPILFMDDIIKEAAKRHGMIPPSNNNSSPESELKAVWKCIISYIGHALRQGKNLHIDNFCTVCLLLD